MILPSAESCEKTVRELSEFRHLMYRVLKWRPSSRENFSGTSDTRQMVDKASDADVITSALADEPGFHTVMLDLDVPARLVPSSTEGHSHLYIDVKLSWDKYRSLLWELASAGIIESGYYDVSLRNCLTSLRLPWIKRKDPRYGNSSPQSTQERESPQNREVS